MDYGEGMHSFIDKHFFMDYLALDQHGGGRIWRDLVCNHFTMEMVKIRIRLRGREWCVVKPWWSFFLVTEPKR